jgi:hypothetical protein
MVECPVVVDSKEEVVDYTLPFADFEGGTPPAVVATQVSPSSPNRASRRSRISPTPSTL